MDEKEPYDYATRRKQSKALNAPWHEQIRSELAYRDDKCKTFFGPLNEYVRPLKASNPYRKFKNINDFKKAYPFDTKHRQKHCKLMYKHPSIKKDINNRFFIDAKHEEQCKNIKGHWDPKAINRINKYDRGVCWVSPSDRDCATLASPDALRPFDVRNNANVKLALDKFKTTCESKDICSFTQPSQFSYDCFSKKRKTIDDKTEQKGETKDPPKNMPKDTRKDMEQFLYEWYVEKKHGKPPSVTELIGTGNRCKPPPPIVNKPTDVARQKTIKRRLPVIDLTKLDPHTVRNDVQTLIDYGVPTEYINEWQHRIGTQKRTGYTFRDNFLQEKIAPYGFDLADLDDEDPIPIEVSNGAENTMVMKPSIPQSVVNMIMKNIANNPEITNRGLLAWHSLGSGKTCTAAGVMDSFWDTKKQIIFASSIDAIASNPDYKFHECAMNLFPRFQQDPYLGKNKEESMSRIAAAFENRGIRFLSFAKLANRVKKTVEYKRLAKLGGARQSKASLKREELKPKRPTKTKPVARQNSKASLKSDEPKRKRQSKAIVKAPHVRKTSKALVTKNEMPKLTKPKPRKNTNLTANPKVKLAANMQRISKDDFVDLDNTILIIDEVHNLFRPLPTQRQQHEYLEKELLDPNRHPNLKIVILTATPGDNIPDVLKLLNIIRDNTQTLITEPNVDSKEDIDRFRNSIRGMISFFDMSQDNTKFPSVQDNQTPLKFPMGNTQLQKYIEAYKEVKEDSKNFDKLAKLNMTSKYWKQARKYANMLFNFDKNMGLSEFSSKMPFLLQSITEKPAEKHYVYSSFYENRGYGGQGIIAISKQLDALGYKKITVQEAKAFNKTSTLPASGKRYILAISSEIGEEGSSSAGKNLHELIKIFNNSQNSRGQLIHVFLASQGFNEGLDLKAVRHVHFFEPLVTMASDKQTIGRAARYCSHVDLDRDNNEWTVQVHRYMSDLPTDLFNAKPNIDIQINQLQQYIDASKSDKNKNKELVASYKKKLLELKKQAREFQKLNLSAITNVEQKIFDESRVRMKQLITVYSIMKEVSLDCRLLAPFHSLTGSISTCAF